MWTGEYSEPQTHRALDDGPYYRNAVAPYILQLCIAIACSHPHQRDAQLGFGWNNVQP